ncbi:DNA topoisomerase IV [Flavobacteriaceae bacterium]|nr:DNA topoisomerase IV [Flavobacteriaceae bacterium]MDA8947624.1 DNA topoisomerase IV [Flavobacteriaceae bacterium]MDA9015860.1 DNA topoisomerase IV [Flavobacteriaceae bacterium]MDB3861943.1 DNA topoisomerase IV [Flavobacteriaceae bacterium]MDC3354911.1 DNA topoisomerase IV [Flavobacteriaceae bacterium]
MRQLLLCTLIGLTSCYTVERDCLPFHSGTFEFSQIINGSLKTSTFTRDSLYEIERYEGKIDTASIRWVNDCECILTKLNPNSNQEKRPIQIKIISTQDKNYTFEYSLVGDSKNTQRGTIQKID